ncbi:adenylyl-sulfate kinase [Pontibacter silvestris]|uniref:Adenylyl-sulfate kinase n=1 Tax=Pontibacter silvestris TaxID=2305183 RepID=A0ABW4WVQ3_9BACT|nr:adenylyl-sulfate kinase [Pontibacter silvestris]MCC9137325.1 adenylyl-sulfate kinase [Pontibacter silvestris]
MEEKLHLVKQCYKTRKGDREARNGHKAGCVWFTGLSGSGKSTLANKVEQELFAKGYMTYVLDGDNIRQGLCKDLSFTEEDRIENIRRISEVAKLMCDSGIVVLAAFVSPFRKDRRLAKELIRENFLEVYVDAPIEVCEQRDVKGLYVKARRGEISDFTGISSPFEVPEFPDVHVQTNKLSVEQSAQLVIDKILPKLQMD